MASIELSPSEKALLEGNHNFSKTKARYLRYRINKKLKLQGQDLTSIGILIDNSNHRDDSAATLRQQPRRWSSLVRMPPQTDYCYEHEIESKNNNGGPDVIRTRDPRHVKASGWQTTTGLATVPAVPVTKNDCKDS